MTLRRDKYGAQDRELTSLVPRKIHFKASSYRKLTPLRLGSLDRSNTSARSELSASVHDISQI